MTRWNTVYGKKTHVFGRHANGLIWQHLQDAPEGPVLDVGCGEGRNGLMAAGLGRDVLALDFSQVAVDRANAWAGEAGLQFKAEVADVINYAYPTEQYAGIILALMLPFVRKSAVPDLLVRLYRATIPGGIIFASALLSDDPDAAPHVGKYEEVDPWSFFKPELNEYRTFFLPGEIRQLLEEAQFQVIEYLEGVYLEETPAEGAHYHRQAQVVARRPFGPAVS
ncbi:MAG TPA: class I SAM-dependent methyltransferase [Symbiobacteriaceae bacterium]|jgi:2-polyprenyl-3-methyl-5-hydroxy-6-metoxy-1,4-benzoquinol methylase